MFFKENKAIAFVLLIAFALNIYVIANNFGNVFNQPERYGVEVSKYGSRDASLYAKMANQLLDDGIYAYNSTESNAYVTPSQPFYLATVFLIGRLVGVGDYESAVFANVILHLFTILFIYLINLKIAKSKLAGVAGALLYALYFTPLHMNRTLLTETPAIFFMMLSLYLFVKSYYDNLKKYDIMFGFAFSVLVMFRPTPVPLLLAGFYAMIYKYGIHGAFHKVKFWVIGAVVIMSPWVIRNLLLFEHLYLFSSHGGDTFLAGTNPFFLENYNDIVGQMNDLGLNHSEFGKQRLINGIKTDTDLYVAWFTVGKFVNLFLNPDSFPLYVAVFSQYRAFFYLEHYFILTFAFVTMLKLKNNPIKILTFLSVGYICLSLIFLPITRYGFFIIPILCVIVGQGIYGIKINYKAYFADKKSAIKQFFEYKKNNVEN